MNIQHRSVCVAAAACLVLAAFCPAIADDGADSTVEEAVIIIEAAADGNAGAPVVVEVRSTNAGGQAFVVQARGGARFGAYDVREDVDPQDGIERFVLMLQTRPLVVETTLTIDGEPFRMHREKLIDEMLAAGDRDGDGTVTWEEALGTSGFTYGRILPEQQRTRYIEMLDEDKNGEVSRSEARGFLAVVFQGPAFLVTGGFANRGGGAVLRVNGQPYGYNVGQANVTAMLDSDGNGILSAEEIEGAGERLQSRDADGNDLLVAGEIGAATGGQPGAVNQQSRQPAQQQSFLLGPTVNLDSLYAAFREKYLTTDGQIRSDEFVGAENPFAPLDADGNGSLSSGEVLLLNEIEPHVRLNVDLGTAEGESKLSLTYLEGGEKSGEETDSTVGVEFPGVDVTFSVSTAAVSNFNYETTAQRMLDQYDGDNNEYLELSELPDNFAQQFEAWDGDTDGKVYKQDIVNGYTQAQRPQQTQVQVATSQAGDPLFPALDLSGDGRLSLREMRTAHQQLAAFDGNGDGQLTPTEVPVSHDVSFRIGNGYSGNYRVITAVGRGGVQPAAAPTGNGPQWFLRMDRNGDGDVTLKEFLGNREAFEELDTNGDGFIEPAEASAVADEEEED